MNTFEAILGRYCYVLAHATPFQRGSASVLEWSLKAICLYRNSEIDWKKPRWITPDQKAFSTLLIDDFVDKFTKEVHLSQLE